MQFGFSSLVALAAVVTAQSAEPKISANELVESISVIAEAVQDAVEMTSNLPAEADDARVGYPPASNFLGCLANQNSRSCPRI